MSLPRTLIPHSIRPPRRYTLFQRLTHVRLGVNDPYPIRGMKGDAEKDGFGVGRKGGEVEYECVLARVCGVRVG